MDMFLEFCHEALFFFVVFGGVVTSLMIVNRWLPTWACKVFGWHFVRGGSEFFDGASLHAHCARCGREVMQDSQGNWF